MNRLDADQVGLQVGVPAHAVGQRRRKERAVRELARTLLDPAEGFGEASGPQLDLLPLNDLARVVLETIDPPP